MKMSLNALLLVLSGLSCPAASSSLLRRRASTDATQPAGLVAAAPAPSLVGSDPRFVNDPALGVVASSGGGDFFTKAWTGENAGDAKRGTGSCTAFRRTLKCDPSGIRDPKQDKGCAVVVKAGESGFCECGDYAQYAAVDCEHRPFTCEVMCLKFAVVTGKPAVFRNMPMTPEQAKGLLSTMMWANQTDLEAMRMMNQEVQDFTARALKYNTESADKARSSMEKFMAMMKVAREGDAAKAAAELAAYRNAVKNKPWLSIYNNGGEMIKAGRAIQAKVLDVLPFDPASNNAVAATPAL